MKNVNFYKFFKPDFDLAAACRFLREKMVSMGIKGTVLLGSDGINASLCGPEEKMDAFIDCLFEAIRTQRPAFKISYSDAMCFKRSLVKAKRTIVADPGSTPLNLNTDAAPYISSETFHQWLTEEKEMLVLDTRNDYEFEAGRFKNSVHLGNKHFAQFEKDLNKLAHWQDKPVVTFCTGGIRCEKAAPLMIKKGFKEVYQLEGGILNYFEKIGSGHFEGECFIFDERVKVNPNALFCGYSGQ